MSIDLLCGEDKRRALKMEELAEIGKEIHFYADLSDGKFLLRKKCNHMGGVYTHEFGIYHSFSGQMIYFHRCDNCTYAVRISEQDYRRAKQIHDEGGQHID